MIKPSPRLIPLLLSAVFGLTPLLPARQPALPPAARSASLSPASSPSDHLAYQFHHVRVEAGGFITGILFHPTVPGLAYLRTDIGGAYRWDGSTGRWTSLSEWISTSQSNLLGVESMAVDPAHPDDLYLAAGTYTHPGVPNGALLRSHDRGAHFQILPLPFQLGGNEPGRFAGERLALDPAHPGVLFLGTRNNGLWRSKDFGSTWQPVCGFPGKSTNGIGIVFAVFGPHALDEAKAPLYVGVSTLTGPNLYVSPDGGTHWAPVPGAPQHLLPYHAAFTADGTLYLTYGNAPGPNDVSGGAVWKRSAPSAAVNSGQWKEITPEPTSEVPRGFGYAGLALDPHNPDTVIVSTLDRWQPGDTLFASHDRGQHWVSLTDHAVRDASASPYLVHGGKLPFGHWIGAVAIDPRNPNLVFYGTGETLWMSRDFDQAWSDQPTHWTVGAEGIEETAVISLLAPSAGAPLFPGLGDIGCFRADSVAPGAEATALEPPSLSNCDAVAGAARHPGTMAMVGRVWSGPSHGGSSLDGGLHWQPFPSEPAGSAGGGSAAVSADGRTLLWTTGDGIFATADGGAHWRSVAPCGRARVVADPHNPGRVFVLPRSGDTLFAANLASVLSRPDAQSPERSAGRDAPADSVTSLATSCNLSGVAGFQPLAHGLAPAAGIVADPQRPRVWIFGAKGLLLLDSNNGSLRPMVPDADVSAFAVGAPLVPKGPEALFLAGKMDGHDGMFRSGDDGKSWQHIDDAQHGFGYITTMAADPKIPGRVYLGTNGLGVIVATPTQ